MDLATIRQAVRDNYPESVSATALDRRIAAAVREYSRYNPRAISTTFETVAEQAAYTLDVDDPVNGIGAALWFPGGTISEVRDALEDMLREPVRYGIVSQYVIEDIKESAHVSAFAGDWEWRAGTSEIVLDPTPTTAGNTVYVTYLTGHVLNEEEGEGYDTIPDADLEIIRDLALAELLAARQIEAAMTPDMAEGLERVTMHFMGGNIAQVITQLRGKLIGKYGGTAIYVGP